MLRCYGIRGATTVAENTREAILEATRELLELIVPRNEIVVEDVSSAFFTVTEDLDAEHPALAARQIGWERVALLCSREIPVPGSLGMCVPRARPRQHGAIAGRATPRLPARRGAPATWICG